jgi:nicotinamide riboside kinase
MEEQLKQQPTSLIKIALYGPESTGKSTLAQQLASHFKTNWVAEYARDYLQDKWNTTQEICTPEDLLPIAIGQVALENTALQTATDFVFCDTTLLVTKVYSEMYYQFCDPVLDKAARKHKYDLFFLTDIDVPWEADDLRDRPQEREDALAQFEAALVVNQKPFLKLSGNKEERLAKAIRYCIQYQKAKALGFNGHDFVQLIQHGLDLDTLAQQIHFIKQGSTRIMLDRPALKGDGILVFSSDEMAHLAQQFDQNKTQLKLKKFVPASGAASRMFKFLNEFLAAFDPENETINAYINRSGNQELNVFLAGIEKFPFYAAIRAKLQLDFPDFSSWEYDKQHYYTIVYLLHPNQLDSANKPKGVLEFHTYPTHLATPIEEHLKECTAYASANGISHLHLTVSQAHENLFQSALQAVQANIESATQTQIRVNYSYQFSHTDTIAVAENFEPFKDENKSLVIRPAGHGALIHNLSQLDADLVFIKNIDNVIQNRLDEIALYKKALAGYLLQLQEKVFLILRQIDSQTISEYEIDSVVDWMKNSLNCSINEDFYKFTIENKWAYIKEKLNRPIRVCGMVKNEGEPGGGPFWVRNAKGHLSLQIVESSQVDLQNNFQRQMMQQSTHFNPVDLVCGLRNYRGEKFDLAAFVDPNTGFVVDKNKNGIPFKAYELPGLWNGAMARWLTVFVEVPLLTFNPVKTVNDLLKSAHQPH